MLSMKGTMGWSSLARFLRTLSVIAFIFATSAPAIGGGVSSHTSLVLVCPVSFKTRTQPFEHGIHVVAPMFSDRSMHLLVELCFASATSNAPVARGAEGADGRRDGGARLLESVSLSYDEEPAVSEVGETQVKEKQGPKLCDPAPDLPVVQNCTSAADLRMGELRSGGVHTSIPMIAPSLVRRGLLAPSPMVHEPLNMAFPPP